jgi:FdhD protein
LERLSLGEMLDVVHYDGGHPEPGNGEVIREGLVRLHVNGTELVRLMCSPVELDRLALGFLRNERVIRSLDDVRRVVICPSRTCVDVWLQDAFWAPTGKPILTSGCGGGITFTDIAETAQPLDSDLLVTPDQITGLMMEFLAGGTERQRGAHAAALATGDVLLAVAEDVGRHNTIDRLCGQFLMDGISTRDRILLSTGRISSEMLLKAARMETPVIVSRSSPTGLSVALAHAWGITLIGYVRRTGFNVYAGQRRITQD